MRISLYPYYTNSEPYYTNKRQVKKKMLKQSDMRQKTTKIPLNSFLCWPSTAGHKAHLRTACR